MTTQVIGINHQVLETLPSTDFKSRKKIEEVISKGMARTVRADLS